MLVRGYRVNPLPRLGSGWSRKWMNQQLPALLHPRRGVAMVSHWYLNMAWHSGTPMHG